ncbi:uncharacterized protein OCT59_017623 [Rhizophagus irregularis]|uniref:uncharacterized protein n=1 Tax=Rhizophagus irregularis TaxID=588596 RepID=UPI00332593AC|nr:hypothetical protein OCT59_017623 [Rhizophagus irregularis]
MGGLIWADNEWKGYGRQYAQQVMRVSAIERELSNQTGLNGNNILFRQKGIYRSYSAHERAKKLGADNQLMQDGKPDALIYDREASPWNCNIRRIYFEEQPDSPALFTCSENADTTLKTLKFETAGYCHVKNAKQGYVILRDTQMQNTDGLGRQDGREPLGVG